MPVSPSDQTKYQNPSSNPNNKQPTTNSSAQPPTHLPPSKPTTPSKPSTPTTPSTSTTPSKPFKFKGFHIAESADKDKINKLQEEIGEVTWWQKPIVKLLSLTVTRVIEVLIDLFIFFVVLIPENYEFFHILKERFTYHQTKTKGYTAHTLAESFTIWCPIIEGIVCVIHTIIFVAESFLGIEIEHGLLIALLASFFTCLLICIDVEIIDRQKSKHPPRAILFIEILVAVLNILTIFCYVTTEERFRTFLLLATVITQYLCRTLTRLVEDSHNALRKHNNRLEVRILIGVSIILLALLLQITALYYQLD
ncbi:hypothetical protein NEHOM01_0352 [Nematocida homosporus]|uniref:uncharacterized protein n=1 Tax=Nematocida homosporus TaxID=1912981 RepID=UPI00221E4EBC|nr:uncharacterized protein NEHOM01_0352 [Nematocida homosporus]KAI5184750.1 hypothetical protein NEHOM01_0352 [Nematocida homosporus]